MRPMTHERFMEFRDLHLATFYDYEFTKLLGGEYMTLLWDAITSWGMAFGFYEEVDGMVVAYSIGYLNKPLLYEVFRKKYRFKITLIWIKRIMSGAFSSAYVLNALGQLFFKTVDNKTRKVADPRAHLGFIALRQDYQGTPEGREMVKACIGAVLEEHKRLGYRGTWGGIDSRNIKMVKMLERFGMSQVDCLKLPGREIIIVDIEYGNA
jgi:hypothetical protein